MILPNNNQNNDEKEGIDLVGCFMISLIVLLTILCGWALISLFMTLSGK